MDVLISWLFDGSGDEGRNRKHLSGVKAVREKNVAASRMHHKRKRYNYLFLHVILRVRR